MLNIDFRTTEIYDTKSNTWRSGPELPYTSYAHSLVKISENEVLFFGGFSNGYKIGVALYNWSTKNRQDLPNLSTASTNSASTLITLSVR